MINFFQHSSNDQSIYFLGQIFGPVGTALTVDNTKTVHLILGQMFQTFNSVILAVGAVVVIYTTIVGLFYTAHEGQFLGKKWHQLWTPLRMLFGIAALVPSVSGYSAIQILMMWIILQGVGAADTMWSTVLHYKAAFGSITGGAAASGSDKTTVNTTLQNLFQGLVCQASAQVTDRDNVPQPRNYCAENPADVGCAANPFNSSPDVNTYAMFRRSNDANSADNFCGSLTYCNQTSACSSGDATKCAVCRAQVEALSSIIPTLSAIAQSLAKGDVQYRAFNNMYSTPTDVQWLLNFCAEKGIGADNCCLKSPFDIFGTGKCKVDRLSMPDPGSGASVSDPALKQVYWKYVIKDLTGGAYNFIDANTQAYLGTIVAASASSQTQNSHLDATLQAMEATGWIYAGAYYYYVASENSSQAATAVPPLTMNANTNVGSTTSGNPLAKSRNNFSAALTLVNFAATGGKGGGIDVAGAPELAQGQAVMNSLGANLIESVGKYLTGAGSGVNPLISLQSFGELLLLLVQAAYLVIITIAMTIGLLGNISIFVWGFGVTNPAGPLAMLLTVVILPIIVAAFGLCVTYGAMLAVYVPLIPYTIFTFGVISWFISVIEALVAAPLVALGILSPGGEHELLGKSAPALMLIFSIFLRPTLMIIGLIAGTLLSMAVVTMLNFSFAAAYTGITGYQQNGVVAETTRENGNLLETFIFLGAYVSLIVSALNKCYALIHIVPDRTLTWIGGHHGTMGQEAERGLEAMKSGVEGAAQGAGGMIKQSGGQAMQNVKDQAKRDVDKKEQEARDKKAGDKPGGLQGSGGGGAGGGGGGGSGSVGGPSGGGGAGGGTPPAVNPGSSPGGPPGAPPT